VKYICLFLLSPDTVTLRPEIEHGTGPYGGTTAVAQQAVYTVRRTLEFLLHILQASDSNLGSETSSTDWISSVHPKKNWLDTTS
jgi:hypothetical protein